MRFNRLCYLLCGVVLVLAVGIPISAQENNVCRSGAARTISYGDTLSGIIDDDQMGGTALYCFEAGRGDIATVTITAADDRFLPLVVMTEPIFDPSGATVPDALGETQLSEDGRTAITQVTFEENQTVLIIVQGNQGTQGEYTLTLSAEQRSLFGDDGATATEAPAANPNAVSLCETPSTQTLVYGDTVRGFIGGGVPFNTYCFEGTAGDNITVEASTLNGDLIVGVILAEPLFDPVYAEEINTTRNALAQAALTLPEDGEYAVIVTRQGIDQGTSSGEYELQLLVDAPPIAPPDCTNSNVQLLNQHVWGIPGRDTGEPVMSVTVSCLGIFSQVAVMSGGRLEEFSLNRDGDVVVPAGDGRYTTVTLNDNEWVLDNQDGYTLALERLPNDVCTQGAFPSLIQGVWVMDFETVLILDFTCGDVAYLVDGSQVQRVNYVFEAGEGTLTLNTNGGSILFEDVTIDGTTMTVSNQGNTLTFQNTLAPGASPEEIGDN